MGILIAALVVIALGGAMYLFVCCQKSIHVSAIVINRDFGVVWKWISDPLKYDKLYPNWIKKVEGKEENAVTVHDQFGQTYPIKLELNRETGLVDLHISLPTGEEVSRSRVYTIASGQTAVTHLAHRFKGATSIIWFFHKRTTDRDFENAKRVIELDDSLRGGNSDDG